MILSEHNDNNALKMHCGEVFVEISKKISLLQMNIYFQKEELNEHRMKVLVLLQKY